VREHGIEPDGTISDPSAGCLSRRTFIRGAGTGLAALWGSRLLGIGAGAAAGGLFATAPAGAAEHVPFSVPLPVPPVLIDPDITLVAREADVQILPGAPTRMWTLGGSFPGPTIRRPSGEATRLTVRHELPEEVGTLTIHHHGSHSSPDDDGQPRPEVEIAPGAERAYTYEFMEDGSPERAAFQWYHDHSHFRTGRNVWRGLAGMVILDDAVDSGLPLPRGDHDIPLMIATRQFDADNQLTDPFTAPDRSGRLPHEAIGAGFPPGDEVVGLVPLVNGAAQPFMEVEPRRYRFRILNAANFTPYNLFLTNDQDLVQIATESGLMPAPLARSEVLLGPAERVEVIVDFTGRAGETIRLESKSTAGAYSPKNSVLPATTPQQLSLLEFRVTKPLLEPDTSSVPDELRALPEWVGEIEDNRIDRVWAFGMGVDGGGRPAWTINGQPFDHSRVDARPVLGTVEHWALVNTSQGGKSHYIHIHDVDWKVVSRNGSLPPPEEDCLKETFRLDPGDIVVVAAKFTDHVGPYMMHCHMLEHEDHGMMATFEVVPPGSVTPVARELSSGDLHRPDLRCEIPAARSPKRRK
jgi:FtsP/CotA-like multicopper oxidase with cupredoxin domain